MPRVKSPPKKCVKPNTPTNSWVFLMKADGLDASEVVCKSDIVKLRHPASNQAALFLFSPGDLMVQEVLTVDENKRSWFIDDNIKSDGKMHLSTPIDPLFLALPYLQKSQYAVPLEQLLKDDDYPDTERLTRCQNLKLSLVADRRGEESLQAYKYNEEKTMSWLQKKVERVSEVLKQKGIHVSQGAFSANYVKNSKNEGGTESEYLRYAHGIVSEYLSEDLSKKLLQFLNIPEEVENTTKRKLASPKETTDIKRTKIETTVATGPTKMCALDLTKSEKPQKQPTKKELARQKAAAGSKNISNFFKKK